MNTYVPSENRYEQSMQFTNCGNSGLQLPVVSLGLWHNFGEVDAFANCREMLTYAFDHGITHFDLANNYGPPPGSAEQTFGKILRKDFANYRDEMIISSKAGHRMWPGPYGDGCSRKSMMASIDQSLRRTGLEYFDIFYSHRYDSTTPIEETMRALADIVRQGKALYVGLSKYPIEEACKAMQLLKEEGVPCLIYQDRYNMLMRDVEKQHFDLVQEAGAGFIAFSPLAQGLLTNKYLKNIPTDSRAAKPHGFLQESAITPHLQEVLNELNNIAQSLGKTLAELALLWILRKPEVTSVIIGSSSVEQLKTNLSILDETPLSEQELDLIDEVLAKI